MASFVQANAANTTTLGYSSNVTSGNLLLGVYEGSTPPTIINDTRGTSYTQIFSNSTISAFFGIAPSTGANTVTPNQIGSNSGILIAEYSAITSLNHVATATLPATNNPSISVGPVTMKQGAILVCVTFAQSTNYSSSSGAHTDFANGARVNLLASNLTASSPYTETGVITGGMAFGGTGLLFGIGLPASSPNSLMLMGCGT